MLATSMTTQDCVSFVVGMICFTIIMWVINR